MPVSKSTRTSKSKMTNGASQSASTSQITVDKPNETDFSQCSVLELITIVKDRNRDLVIEAVVQTLAAKIPIELAKSAEAETRARTIVISGLGEANGNLLPSQHRADVEGNVTKVFDVLGVPYRSSDIFRMGKLDQSRPPLVKVPSIHHWRHALTNARQFRTSGFASVYVRRTMTSEERKHEFELRQQARGLNQSIGGREWVVFRGELRRLSKLPKRSGNASFGRVGRVTLVKSNASSLMLDVFVINCTISKPFWRKMNLILFLLAKLGLHPNSLILRLLEASPTPLQAFAVLTERREGAVVYAALLRALW